MKIGFPICIHAQFAAFALKTKHGNVTHVPYPLVSCCQLTFEPTAAADVILLAFAITRAQTADIAWDQDKRARKL